MKHLHILRFLLLFSATPGQGQGLCDSLTLQVAYQPFYDSLIEVRVHNASQTFINYPGFILYDSNNDTVAKEAPNLFGISQYSVHTLKAYPGMITSPQFTGRLELYTYAFDSLLCDFPMSFDLCPDTCQQAIFYLGNMGSALFTGTVSYEIRNTNSQPVKSGTLTIGSTTQYDADTACLMPGSYTLHLTQNNLTPGGQKYYGLMNDTATTAAPFWIHNGTNDTVFSFSFYKSCPGITAVPSVGSPGSDTRVFMAGRMLCIVSRTAHPVERVIIYTADGRMVSDKFTNVAEYRDYLGALSPGIYFVHLQQQGKLLSRKILVQ